MEDKEILIFLHDEVTEPKINCGLSSIHAAFMAVRYSPMKWGVPDGHSGEGFHQSRCSMRTMSWAIGLCFVVTVFGIARADEEKLPLDKVPKAIKATIAKRFPKADLVGASKETENGKTEFEVSIKDGAAKIDATFDAEGNLLVFEKEIASKDLPKAVRDAIEVKYPKSTIKLAEEVVKVKDGKEKLEFYEAIVDTADKKSFELQVASDGKIIKTEDKSEKKD